MWRKSKDPAKTAQQAVSMPMASAFTRFVKIAYSSHSISDRKSSSPGKKKLRGNPRLEHTTTQNAFDCILPGLEDSKSSKHRFTSIQSNDSRHSYRFYRQYAGCPPSPQASKSRNKPVAVVSGDNPETMTWSITLLHKKCHDWEDMGSGHKAFPAIHSWLIWWFKRLCLWLLANFSIPQFLWFRQLWGVQYFGWSEISHIAVITSAHWRNLDLDSKKSYQIHQFVRICTIYSNIVLEHFENLHTPLEDIRESRNGGIELRTVVIPSSLESWTPCHRSTSNLVNKKKGIEYEYDVYSLVIVFACPKQIPSNPGLALAAAAQVVQIPVHERPSYSSPRSECEEIWTSTQMFSGLLIRVSWKIMFISAIAVFASGCHCVSRISLASVLFAQGATTSDHARFSRFSGFIASVHFPWSSIRSVLSILSVLSSPGGFAVAPKNEVACFASSSSLWSLSLISSLAFTLQWPLFILGWLTVRFGISSSSLWLEKDCGGSFPAVFPGSFPAAKEGFALGPAGPPGSDRFWTLAFKSSAVCCGCAGTGGGGCTRPGGACCKCCCKRRLALLRLRRPSSKPSSFLFGSKEGSWQKSHTVTTFPLAD